MNTLQTSPGFYGKLHTRGDFVSRRLPVSFVSPWDEWLQQALSASRSELGEQWLDIYLTSPIWRFALSAGTCGNRACAGILMPSVDNVGRYFPLTLAVLLDQETVLPGIFLSGVRWFEELERIALSALDDYFNFEQFDRHLQNLVFEPILAHEDFHFEAEGFQRESRRPFFRVSVCELAQIRNAFIDLSSFLLDRFSPAYSLWCTSGSERVKPSLSAYAGMPPPSSFVEFLAGETRHRDLQNAGTRRFIATEAERKPCDIERQLDATQKIVKTKWCSHACSNPGAVRQINEDAYLERPEIGLWAVADGMGGHKSGQVASKAVVDALKDIPEAGGVEELTGNVHRCLQKVNTDLVEMGQALGEGVIVGSTVVALLADDRFCVALWAGDSRLYRYRDGGLEQLTRDHSLISEFSLQGRESHDEPDVDGLRSVITRALGAESSLVIDKLAWEIREKDIFLLCSDGLVREVGDLEIADILSGTDIEQSPQAMVDAAIARGARDNVTVIVVHAGN